jgi:hypothetical protein
MTAQKLHTVNFDGNLHYAAAVINSWGWAEYVMSLHPTIDHTATVAVFRMPAAKVHELRHADGSDNPGFDDYTGPVDPYSVANVATAKPTRTRSTKPAAEVLQEMGGVTAAEINGVTGQQTLNEVTSVNEPTGTVGGAQMVGDDDVVPQFIRNGMSSTVASDFAADVSAALAADQTIEQAATSVAQAATKRGPGRPRKNQIAAVQGQATKIGDEIPEWAMIGDETEHGNFEDGE